MKNGNNQNRSEQNGQNGSQNNNRNDQPGKRGSEQEQDCNRK